MEIYINGKLESFTTFNGLINPSPVDLEIAQIMPDDPSYNFGGILDEIKIFDYALLPDSVFAESGQVPTSLADEMHFLKNGLFIYPNPAHESITIQFNNSPNISSFSPITYHLFNILGQEKLNGTFNDHLRPSINISSLHPGMYFLQVAYADQSWSSTCWIQ